MDWTPQAGSHQPGPPSTAHTRSSPFPLELRESAGVCASWSPWPVSQTRLLSYTCTVPGTAMVGSTDQTNPQRSSPRKHLLGDSGDRVVTRFLNVNTSLATTHTVHGGHGPPHQKMLASIINTNCQLPEEHSLRSCF